MQQMSLLVQDYIKLRLESDPTWKNLKVIFSDCSVPGEGEHKVRSPAPCSIAAHGQHLLLDFGLYPI